MTRRSRSTSAGRPWPPLRSVAARWGARLTLFGALLAAPRAYGHDSWLISAADAVAAGAEVRVAFVTSEHFPRPEHATAPERVAEWFAVSAKGRQAISAYAIDGQALVATTRLERPGVHVLAAGLAPRFLEMAPDKFDEYLASEKADDARKRRAAGERGRPGYELYTKLSKCFVAVGETPRDDATFSAPVGLSFELAPLSNPCLFVVGQAIEVRVFVNGRPAPGVRVCAGNEEAPAHSYVAEAVSDFDGIARFRFDRPGLWFFRAHRIRPIAPDEAQRLMRAATPASSSMPSPVAEWASEWTSMTARVRPASPQTHAETASQPADWPHTLVSNDQRYRVSYRTRPTSIPLHDLFQMDVLLRDAGGAPLGPEVELRVDAAMPEHEHGMNTQPVARRLEQGLYRVEGMLFHMPGNWELYFDIRRGGVTERAQHSIVVE